MTNNRNNYNRELTIYSKEKRLKEEEEKQKHIEFLISLREKYDIPPNEQANYKELNALIEEVIITGKSGRVVIKKFAQKAQKSDKWRKDVAKAKANKLFKMALSTHNTNPVIISMIGNNVYNEKEIMNNSISGALTTLSKQIDLSKQINDLKNENVRLKESLAAKNDGQDLKKKIPELRAQGYSIREIQEETGIPKSTISDYLRKIAVINNKEE